MNRKSVTALLALLTTLTLTGCQLAKPDLTRAKTADRLIGVFVTPEYLDLFDMEGYLNDNLGGFSGGELIVDGSQSEKYNGRLYATLTARELTSTETGGTSRTQEYVFEGVEGIPFFTARMWENGESYQSSMGSQAVMDAHFGSAYKDGEEKITMEGTIYLVPGKAGNAHYVNPVYQSVDGSVYATSGQGISVGGVMSEGEVISQKMEDSVTVTENGETVKNTTVVDIAIKTMLPSKKITVLQMDADSLVLLRTEYAPEEMPETITPDKRTQYIILEAAQTGFDGSEKIKRTLFSKEDTALESFYAADSGVMCKESTMLAW